MFKEKSRKEEVKTTYIPFLEELFDQIKLGNLDIESDEVITYYFDGEDFRNGVTCVASYNQLMYLYNQAMI